MKDRVIREVIVIIFLAIIATAAVAGIWTLASWQPEAPGADATAQGLWADYHVFQSSAVANGNGTAMSVGGIPLVRVQVQGVTTATINFEATVDGTNWDAVEAIDPSNGSKSTTTTADGQFWIPSGGAYQLRCRISGYSGGTIDVVGYGVTGAGLFSVADAILGANDGVDIGDVTLNNTDDITVTLGGEAVAVSSNVAPAGRAGSTSYVHEPAANTAAQIVLAAPGVGVSHVIGMVAWSYDSLPDVGSSITIEDDTGDLFKLDIDESGPGFIPWDPGLKAAANDAVTVTLAAGGSGINGIVNVHTWTE